MVRHSVFHDARPAVRNELNRACTRVGRWASVRRGVISIAVLLAGGFFACGSGDSADATPALDDSVADVEVALIQSDRMHETRRAFGLTRALRSARLSAGSAGELIELGPREGERVQAEQVLGRVDAELAKAQLRSVRASMARRQVELVQAKKEAERALQLSIDVLPKEEKERQLLRAEALAADLAGSRAQEREAKVRLSLLELRAPFDGVVTGRFAEEGDWVQSGVTILELVATDDLEVVMQLPPELVSAIEIGAAASLHWRGFEANAKIERIVPALDPKTRTLPVHLRPTTPADWLMPGIALEVSFEHELRGGVVVPRDALVEGVQQLRVFRVNGDRAQRVLVEQVACSQDDCLVRGEGLSIGDRVLTRGNLRMQDGGRIRIVERAGPRQVANAEGER